MFYNRYKTPEIEVYDALNDQKLVYCNPKDYFVTEEEFNDYLHKISKGQKLRQEWNDSRKKRIKSRVNISWNFALYIPVALWFIYMNYTMSDEEPLSIWEAILCMWSLWIVGDVIYGLWSIIEWIDDEYGSGVTYTCSQFFPPFNERIEKLLDDYLWKKKMLQNVRKSNESAIKVRATHQILLQNHPYINIVIEAIGIEQAHPKSEYILGDIKFGMTIEELYKTRIFYGLEPQYSEIRLDYRKYEICQALGFGGINPEVTFSFVEKNSKK